MQQANSLRGEAMVAGFKLRPTFNALVATEDEIGPLFEMVERAAAGKLKLAEMAALFWFCIDEPDFPDRKDFNELVMQAGLAQATPALKTLLGQILAGR